MTKVTHRIVRKGIPLPRMRRSVFTLTVLLWVQAYLLGPELMKLPLLWQHFQEHRAQDPSMDLESFLDLHYANEVHEDSGDADHEELPFHHHHNGVVDHCSCVVFPYEPMRLVSFPHEQGMAAWPLPMDDGELSGHAFGLIQPPRGRG